jgi:bacterioferritin-associated ferredoxin
MIFSLLRSSREEGKVRKWKLAITDPIIGDEKGAAEIVLREASSLQIFYNVALQAASCRCAMRDVMRDRASSLSFKSDRNEE